MAAEAGTTAPDAAEVPAMEGDAGDPGAAPVEAAEVPATPAPTVPAVPQRSGVDERFSELTSARNAATQLAEAERAARMAAEQRAAMVQQQLDQMRAELNERFGTADPIAEATAQFQSPEEQQLATIVAKTVNKLLGPVQAKLNRYEQVAASNEAQAFWAQHAKQPEAVKARTEQFYAMYKHTGIDRLIALKQTLGDMSLEQSLNPAPQAPSIVPQVAAQNRTAVAVTAPPAATSRIPAPAFDPKKATADQLWDYLQKHGNTASD